MALTNHDRVGRGMEMLRRGLAPYVAREVHAVVRRTGYSEALNTFAEHPDLKEIAIEDWDAAALLKMMTHPQVWAEVFRQSLGNTERSICNELREVRNGWAHQKAFSSDDVDRALDSIERLLNSVSASEEAEEARKMKLELRRLVYDEQVRAEKRKSGGALIEISSANIIKPWRQVVEPHPDVAMGAYSQAEFAADLWQVHKGQGAPEYADPIEFFRRTFFTESMKQLLISAAKRLNRKGGDPVVQLQTNFGGGKTHTMLALFHLFGGTPGHSLPGIDTILAEAGVESVPSAKRVVLVGNKISPGNPVTKPDGTVVRTLWGELAYQLGGRPAYERIAADDLRATNPGDVLRELFEEYGPCLILIDEWVAYARQLHDQGDLPGGNFETQFSFAQALTESAKLVDHCLLVVSLPASDTAGSPHTQADDVEVGGIRGREALDRLRNVVGRVESSWRPATAEESFEIVRRRLFKEIQDDTNFKHRDVTARAFADFYRSQSSEFPSECRETDYEKRIQAAYPIHPEVFDQLYGTWSTLVKFQRTRGVLRLMATVIHSLWEKGDQSPLILPALIPIDDNRVQFELTRYLSDNWLPIIGKDVDGPESLPLKIDRDQPNLGRISATRRVARAIYFGSAPSVSTAHQGIDDRQVKLACALPGESPAIYGDALRRLAAKATYLYQDGNRYWYSTQPTVIKLAEDRAEQLKRNPDQVIVEMERRLQADLKQTGDFKRIQILPRNSGEILDDYDTRLVVLPADSPHTKEGESEAVKMAKLFLTTRGNSPRIFQNSLVFLAMDKVRFQDMDESIRKYLAWKSILDEKENLDLTPFQVRQAETQKSASESSIAAQLPETYQWLLVPEQPTSADPISIRAIRLSGNEPLATRVSRKLRSEELMLVALGPTVLKMQMDAVPLWRGKNFVPIRQIVEDFSRYVYLPRVRDQQVILDAIQSGLELPSWHQDTFAYADSFDEEKNRFRGLSGGKRLHVQHADSGILVKPDVAFTQIRDEEQSVAPVPAPTGTEGANSSSQGVSSTSIGGDGKATEPKPGKMLPTRYYGSVVLDPLRVATQAGKVSEEVITHLASILGANVKVSLEIEANLPDGASDQLVRIVMENSRVLKFETFGFEGE